MWVLFVAAGWILSLGRLLNTYSYAGIVAAAFLTVLFIVRRQPVWYRIRWRRFRRPLPLAFVLLAAVAFLGGAFNSPNNYDAVTYRLPRVLQWLSAGHWMWITTASGRMNYTAANFEWLVAPVFALTHSDRFLFLLNFVPFLFLPGLLFSTYRMLGVSGRVAWTWMWVLPAAYCYAVQAGSIADDGVGAVLVLASVNLGLRAERENNVSHLWMALLAIALATGLEATNLPLLLPCLVAQWPRRRLLRARLLETAGVAALALLVSYLPIAILNRHFTGDGNGTLGKSPSRLSVHAVDVINGALKLGAQMLQPPFLPGARSLDARLSSLLPARVKDMLKADHPQFGLGLGELPQEELSGLGLGISLLLLSSVLVLNRGRFLAAAEGRHNGTATGVMATAWIAFAFYRNPVGSDVIGRLLTPYYPLLLAPLLRLSGAGLCVRSRLWRWAAILGMSSVILVLVLAPARPLWPAKTVLTKLRSRFPNSMQLERAEQVYSVYRERNDLLGDLRAYLPPTTTTVGLISGPEDASYALWRPLGRRTVQYLACERPWKEETRGLAWVAGKTSLLNSCYGGSFDQLVNSAKGEVVTTRFIAGRLSTGPEEWFVIRLPEKQ